MNRFFFLLFSLISTVSYSQNITTAKYILARDSFKLKTVIDSISIDTLMADASHRKLATSLAIKTYVDNLPSGSTSPAGSNTQIQFNDSGVFGASPNLIWSGSSPFLQIKGNSVPTRFLNSSEPGGQYLDIEFSSNQIWIRGTNTPSYYSITNFTSNKITSFTTTGSIPDQVEDYINGGTNSTIYTSTNGAKFGGKSISISGTSTPVEYWSSVNSSIRARKGNFGSTSFANHLLITAGDASAVGPYGYANGGNVYIRGGSNFNNGTDGNVIIAYTEGASGLPLGKVSIGKLTPTARLDIIGITNIDTTYSVIVTNNTGNTANASMAIRDDGRTGLGTNAPARTLHIQGETRISDLVTDPATFIVGADADGDLSRLVIGTGLSISNDTLNSTVSAGGTVKGTGTTTQIAYWASSDSIAGESNLYWDAANDRLGVGTSSPAYRIDATSTINGTGISPSFRATAAGNAAGVGYKFDGIGIALSAGSCAVATGAGIDITNSTAFATIRGSSTSTSEGAVSVLARVTTGNESAISLVSETINQPSTTNTDLLALRHFTGSTGDVFATSIGKEISMMWGMRTTDGVVSENKKIGRIGMTLTDNSTDSTDADMFFRVTSDSLMVEPMRIVGSTNNVGIGTTSPNASAKLDVSSTTAGFLPPRMTTAERDLISTPAAGLIIFNTTTSKHQGYDGSTWNDFY